MTGLFLSRGHFVLVPYLWHPRQNRLLAMSKRSGESCADARIQGRSPCPAISNVPPCTAVQAAAQILANTAEQAERQHPQHPYAQGVAEVGMLTGAWTRCAPLPRKVKKAGSDQRFRHRP
ncbi:hypothetical protein [Streptomyces sp. NPDC093260]|uniref:hypothetical protein n=1 Tax=Streptomyces sp. NPDC093260 TaxID=3155073 RepID=UPI003412A897